MSIFDFTQNLNPLMGIFGGGNGITPLNQSQNSVQFPSSGSQDTAGSGVQSTPNRVLDRPEIQEALLRMGSAMLSANAEGKGFSGALGEGGKAFADTPSIIAKRQLDQAEMQQKQATQQFGVKSAGFEGDMARALMVMRNPNSTPDDKMKAQAIIDTAQRLQGQFDPISGDYTWNAKSKLGSLPSAQPAPTAQQPRAPIPQGVLGDTQGNPPALLDGNDGRMLLPPPSSTTQGGDMGLFGVQPTGNRKVDAALVQKAHELQLENAAKVAGTMQDSQAALPKVIDNAQQALDLIDSIKNDKAGENASLGGMFGLKGRQSAALPLTEAQRAFQPKIDQLKGKAFLDAYQSIKGAGAITEKEGEKATAAMARFDQAQNPKEFNAALDDLRQVIETGVSRMQGSATMTPKAQAEAKMGARQVPKTDYSNMSDADLMKLIKGGK